MTNILNIQLWNLSGGSGHPNPLDSGEVGYGNDGDNDEFRN